MALKNFKEKLSNIKAFVFDCDGVLTDGGLIMMSDNEIIRIYNAKDGYAIVQAIKKGYHVAIISGGKGLAMEKRFKKLGIKNVYLSCEDKVKSMNDFCAKNGITPEDILYVGDDIPDIKPMKIAGLAVAPIDAVLDVKAIADHVSAFGGGKGCVRDVVEQVLKAKGDWNWE